jgi:hypothetical protein
LGCQQTSEITKEKTHVALWADGKTLIGKYFGWKLGGDGLENCK